MPDLKPDLTLLFDLDVNIALERIKKRSDVDRFESEDLYFFEKVRESYLERAESEPVRFQIIDSALPLKNVEEQVRNVLKEIL